MLAQDNGCDHPIIYTEENFVDFNEQLWHGILGIALLLLYSSLPIFLDLNSLILLFLVIFFALFFSIFCILCFEILNDEYFQILNMQWTNWT